MNHLGAVTLCGHAPFRGVHARAIAGAKKAKDLGYTNVKHYAPGLAGWKAKEKTEKGS